MQRAGEDARTVRRRNALHDHLTKTYGQILKLSESAYAIDTKEPEVNISVAIWKLVEPQDEFHVLLLKGPWQGQAPSQAKAWLGSRFP